jgi:hypothetical protein
MSIRSVEALKILGSHAKATLHVADTTTTIWLGVLMRRQR